MKSTTYDIKHCQITKVQTFILYFLRHNVTHIIGATQKFYYVSEKHKVLSLDATYTDAELDELFNSRFNVFKEIQRTLSLVHARVQSNLICCSLSGCSYSCLICLKSCVVILLCFLPNNLTDHTAESFISHWMSGQ